LASLFVVEAGTVSTRSQYLRAILSLIELRHMAAGVESYRRSLLLGVKRRLEEANERDCVKRLADVLHVSMTRLIASEAESGRLDTNIDAIDSVVFSTIMLAMGELIAQIREWKDMDDKLIRAVVERPLLPRERFDFSGIGPLSFRAKFVFNKEDVHRIVVAFGIPLTFRTEERNLFLGMEGFLILVFRLSHKASLEEMESMFHRHAGELSQCVSHLVHFLISKWKDVLFFDRQRLTAEKLHRFSEYLFRELKCPMRGVIGFVDGTIRPTRKPKYGQEFAYNGWKHLHGLKFQCLVAPDGIIIHSYGPVFAKHNDRYLLGQSDLLQSKWSCKQVHVQTKLN